MLYMGRLGKPLLAASFLALVVPFSYYYASANLNTSSRTAASIDNVDLHPNNANLCDGQMCSSMRIAIVNPTFTAAAYDNSFYNFFRKYKDVTGENPVTDDLNLLSNSVPSKSKQESAIDFLTKHLANSKYNVTILSDADVHDGLIFSLDGHATNVNAYDVMILFHSEYVTQEEYQNIKTFVANGGTLFVMDGNVLYAEVKYDRIAGTIALVKGHGWTFDGKSARRSIGERWANETTEWMGSNYLCFSCTIAFGNNPFHYNHHEEQYITNPNVVIIKNYDAVVTDYKSVNNPQIATYELNYAKGKVIVMGLYSSDIIRDTEFVAFIDKLLANEA